MYDAYHSLAIRSKFALDAAHRTFADQLQCCGSRNKQTNPTEFRDNFYGRLSNQSEFCAFVQRLSLIQMKRKRFKK